MWANKCAPVIEFLDGDFREKGLYPEVLPETYETVLKDLTVPGQYLVYRNGSCFMIEIGVYGRDGWQYCYSSDSRKWYLNR